MTEKLECEHPHEKGVYLFNYFTPNVDDLVNLSVACAIFRCGACGSLYQKALVVSRSYAADGTIPEDFKASLVKIKERKDIDALVKERTNAEVARILTERKKANAGS